MRHAVADVSDSILSATQVKKLLLKLLSSRSLIATWKYIILTLMLQVFATPPPSARCRNNTVSDSVLKIATPFLSLFFHRTPGGALPSLVDRHNIDLACSTLCLCFRVEQRLYSIFVPKCVAKYINYTHQMYKHESLVFLGKKKVAALASGPKPLKDEP